MLFGHPSLSNCTTVDWSELIIIFNSLLRNIDVLRNALADANLDEDVQYDLDEELNDYLMLVQKLKRRYADIPEKGELSPRLIRLLGEF
jgi:hypothetical protein